jgi:hypothetical protein
MEPFGREPKAQPVRVFEAGGYPGATLLLRRPARGKGALEAHFAGGKDVSGGIIRLHRKSKSVHDRRVNSR